MVEYNSQDMGKLATLNGLDDQKTLEEIFGSDIIVYEDVQGSKIWVNWNGKEFSIKPKSISSEKINMIDLAMQNYYNPAINYLNTLDTRVKGLLNKNWWFCFEYFPDNQPANITYSRMPKNGLVLSSICKGNKYNYSAEELDEYSRLFNVDMLPIVFQGKLDQRAIEAIKYFIHTSEKDLEYVFGESSFAYFFYKILNPLSTNSFLMKDDEFQNNLEKLVVKIKDKEISFELLNPLYKRISDTNSTEFIEIYSLILFNFLTFCQSIGLEDIKLKGTKKDEIYIYLICKLFNIYVSEVKHDLIAFDFVVPEFFDKDKFKINRELITNKLTKEFIGDDPKIEYIFKIILGSFNKKKKKPVGVFTEGTLNLFNDFVDKISRTIDMYLKKMHEMELTKSGLVDFGEFFSIEYDKDGAGEVYPDVLQDLENAGSNKKKKGGIPDKKMEIPDEKLGSKEANQ